MADPDIPKFKDYGEGEPIPPVDPEDLRRWHDYERTHTRVNSVGWQWLQGLKAALSPEAEFSDVSSRHQMIGTLTQYNRGQLLAPWHHGEELHEAVFRIAATFPLRHLKYNSYMISGDEHFGFDPNAFVQRLVDETGVSNVWEPIETRVPEGQRLFTFTDLPEGQSPEHKAKRQVRDLVWMIWKRFSPLFSHSDKELPAEVVAKLFADFLIDNMDLVRQLEHGFMDPQYIPPEPVLPELEQRAQRWNP